ncbi:MAG TPA: hypothetical protein VGL15_02610 [Vicinamibacteria bacterium]
MRPLAAPLLVLLAAPAGTQIIGGGYGGRYQMYGDPVEVELEDVARGVGYNHKAVRTQGDLDMLDPSGRYYRLRDNMAEVVIIPVYDAINDVRMLMGRHIEVVGVVRELQYDQGTCRMGPASLCEDPDLPPTPNLKDLPGAPQVSITIWSASDLTEYQKKREKEAPTLSLEALLSKPGERDGDVVRVVGQFRGKNLYGDLPIRSQRMSSDWVIKDDVYAVWVTGKRPRGPGWALDTGLKRDTGKWIEVVGRPATRGGVTYLRAVRVALTNPPSALAQAAPPPPPPERPKVPPVVVFALPLDGEPEVPSDGRFVVQFSKDMDEDSFKGRVLLRYAGPRLAGDREFDALKLSYDQGRRALTVDPGDIMRAGRRMELLLLPGIVDVDGLALIPRNGNATAIAVDVLHYRVAL